MKILITGGAGYLGSILTENLLNNNYEVTVLDNLMYKQTSLSNFFYNPKFNLIKGDVNDSAALKKLVTQHDIIIPLAAIVGMPACIEKPDLAVKVNYEQVKNIVSYSSKSQQILIPNTNSQYGSSNIEITEDSPFKPLSIYAKTKCDAEKVILDSGNGIALRLATVFGMSYRMRLDLLVQDFVYKALTDKYLVLFESHFIRNYIHIRDVASAFLFMIDNYHNCNNQAFNVGLSSANLSKLDLANKIQTFLPEIVVIQNEFKKDLDQRNYLVSNAKIESKGWSPRFTIDDGIKELISGLSTIINHNNRDYTNL